MEEEGGSSGDAVPNAVEPGQKQGYSAGVTLVQLDINK